MWDTVTTSAVIGVPPATLDQWAYLGKGPPYYKLGRHRRYRPREVDAWISANRHGGTSGGDAA